MAGTDFTPNTMNSERLNPDGERALQAALQIIDKAQPADHMRRGAALVEMGDWYMCAGPPEKGLQTYRDAWKDLELGGSTALLSRPRQLAYKAPPASITRSHLTERDNIEEDVIEATFTVTRDGRTTDVTATSHDAPEALQKTVANAVRRARYAPRLDKGEPVDTYDVKLSEKVLAKKAAHE
jgi:hypothetical protein